MRSSTALKEDARVLEGRLDVRGSGKDRVVTLSGRNLADAIRDMELDGEDVRLHLVVMDWDEED